MEAPMSNPNATLRAPTTPPISAARNLILDYYDRLPAVIEHYVGDTAPVDDAFSPGFELPELDDTVREFFAVAEADLHHLGDYGDSRLMLLDLMRNPGTNTTKTVASLLISILSAGFTGLQWKEAHNQALLSVKPHINFDMENNPDSLAAKLHALFCEEVHREEIGKQGRRGLLERCSYEQNLAAFNAAVDHATGKKLSSSRNEH